jgi:hypothetical protein
LEIKERIICLEKLNPNAIPLQVSP